MVPGAQPLSTGRLAEEPTAPASGLPFPSYWPKAKPSNWAANLLPGLGFPATFRIQSSQLTGRDVDIPMENSVLPKEALPCSIT